MPDIQLTLTLDETNLILEALGGMPFVRVHQAIGKIQQQAQSQIQAAPEQESSQTTPKSEQQKGD